MRFSSEKTAQTGFFKRLTLATLCLSLFGLGGCEEPGIDEGEIINEILLPTDTLLNLNCENVGIYTESCVLTDVENPYLNATILEFDVNNPDAETKFVLAAAIPAGPTGAKARFYLWATALARRASGENQYFTALALHELYDLNEDPLIRDQALKAYRSVLDNFFGSVVFFECCANIDPDGNPVPFSVPLNELTADAVYRTEATGFERLVPGDPLLAQSLLAEWGYTYQPATGPNFDNGVVSVNDG
ncbi:MAG: hypothetical protein AB8G17_14800 [Gammaproteobacteria bacterium]